MRIDFERSGEGCGWSVTLGVRGRHRVRWNSTKATTRKPPRITRGADEHCNRAVTLMLWPLGHLDVWWEPRRTRRASGRCVVCTAEFIARRVCAECGCRPCDCVGVSVEGAATE